MIELGGFEVDNAFELLALPMPIMTSDARSLWRFFHLGYAALVPN